MSPRSMAAILVLAALLVAGCDLAALGTGRTDCGQLDAVECREALLLAAETIGRAPGDVVADDACVGSDCPAFLDWIVVYPLADGEAIALRIRPGEGDDTIEAGIVTEVPTHVGVRLDPRVRFLASPRPRPTAS